MAKWGTVLDITEIRRISDTKDIETVYRYTVRSAGGTVFTEIIKEADIANEKVDKLLQAKAEKLDKTKAL